MSADRKEFTWGACSEEAFVRHYRDRAGLHRIVLCGPRRFQLWIESMR